MPHVSSHRRVRAADSPGVYVWGKDWIQAKTQAESYDYLFEAAIKMNAIGLDYRRPPPPTFAAAANGDSVHEASAPGPAAKKLKVKHSAT